MVELAEDDIVKTLFQNFRNTAGTEPQPGWNVPNPNTRNLTAPMVARMGQDIPVICKQSLNIAAYCANMFKSVGRQVTAARLSRSRLRKLKKYKQIVDNHNDPESLPELIKTFTIMKLLHKMHNRKI